LGLLRHGRGDPVPHSEAAFDDLDAPIEYIHCDEIPVPFSHPLEEAMLPSVDRIAAGVKEVTYK